MHPSTNQQNPPRHLLFDPCEVDSWDFQTINVPPGVRSIVWISDSAMYLELKVMVKRWGEENLNLVEGWHQGFEEHGFKSGWASWEEVVEELDGGREGKTENGAAQSFAAPAY